MKIHRNVKAGRNTKTETMTVKNHLQQLKIDTTTTT